MKSLSNISDILCENNYFYILTHKNPDGDTLGSAYAVCRALQLKGKKAKILCNDKMSEKYKFMEKYIHVQDFNPEFIISVDVADTSQLGESLMEYSDRINLCIDHHMTNRNYADVTFVDSISSSTSEIIYKLVKEMGLDIDKGIAECIYTGLSTDTGCFSHSNVTAQTHRIAADLIEKGIDLSSINDILFKKKSKNFLTLEASLYKTIEYFFQGKCAVMTLTLDMIKKSEVPENELEGIASIPRNIDGVEVGITIREKPQNEYRVSVRTTTHVSAVGICNSFGGGGHACAAGCTIRGDIENVRSKLLLCIKEYLRP